MHDPALSDEADPLYRPLGDLAPWCEVEADGGAWDGALGLLASLQQSDPSWSDMVHRGARLAAAHDSGVMDGVIGRNPGLAMALLSGVASPAGMEAGVRAHVKAIDDALGLAAGVEEVSEDTVRLVHEVACRPQLAHPVRVEDRVQDHVLAHGEYKHHPNHVPFDDGTWRAHAPVAQVGGEMRAFADALGSRSFAGLHPTVRAAYALHGLTHVSPFADGNGRVARALAGAYLLRSGGVPLFVPATHYEDAIEAADAGDVTVLVEFVLRRVVNVVTTLAGLHGAREGAPAEALDRWRQRTLAAGILGGLLPEAARRALERHRGRTDLGWLPPLEGAEVVPPPAPGQPVVVSAAPPGGAAVEEVLRVDAHPLDVDGPVVLRAEGAQLRLEVAPDEPEAAVSARLGPWLDRVVSTLALRLAAERE